MLLLLGVPQFPYRECVSNVSFLGEGCIRMALGLWLSTGTEASTGEQVG